MSADVTVALPVSDGLAAKVEHVAVSGQGMAVLRDYVSLTKPRIVVLLVLTEMATMVMAAHGMPSVLLVAWASIGGALAAGGASAINCWYDRDIDMKMARTRQRPLPAGRLQPARALIFGLVLTAAAFAVFDFEVGRLAALLALAGGCFYVLVYTMTLKRSTPLNIVIGGAAGAFPPLVAWASIRGDVEWLALTLFAVIFLWTPPHFWSLALLLRDDYRNARVPMLPVLVGRLSTYRRIFAYLLVLSGVALMPGLTLGVGYTVAVAILDLGYLSVAAWARRSNTARSSQLLFHYSLIYLALVFVCGAMAAAA